jgi:hypothetical protein
MPAVSRQITKALVAAAVALFAALFASAAAAAEAGAVGEVSLAIGVSRVIRASANHMVERGMAILPGDRIETERGGHVHLRFVDGAYVAVRPGSRLTVESYDYDPAQPQNGSVRFRLESGVARAISGKIAESARERFRLNTPIAAIGVRGTDFVVLAEADRVRVAVHSGAIVLAPLGEGCQANALGPCATSAARTLSADMGRVMLEFQPQQGTPRVVPVNGIPSPDRVNPPAPQEPRASASRSDPAGETKTEVFAAQAVSNQAVTQAVASQAASGLRPIAPTLPPATLVWGRWAASPLPGDTLSVPFQQALAGREVTVGTDYYALFRPEPVDSQLSALTGKVDFTLRDSQVNLLRNGAAEMARVDRGTLSMDFNSRQFTTGLTMSHPEVGTATLQASGPIQFSGIFVSRQPDTVVAGSITGDAKEAGYFFEKMIPGATFMGITRWAR